MQSIYADIFPIDSYINCCYFANMPMSEFLKADQIITALDYKSQSKYVPPIIGSREV